MEKFNNFFKTNYSTLILVSIMFLFFLELFSDFVECVYIFALMTLSININVLSVLFFFSSMILLFFRKKVPDKVQINTLDRPGAIEGLQAASLESLQKIMDYWTVFILPMGAHFLVAGFTIHTAVP